MGIIIDDAFWRIFTSRLKVAPLSHDPVLRQDGLFAELARRQML